jgi:hypothetical protein
MAGSWRQNSQDNLTRSPRPDASRVDPEYSHITQAEMRQIIKTRGGSSGTVCLLTHLGSNGVAPKRRKRLNMYQRKTSVSLQPDFKCST